MTIAPILAAVAEHAAENPFQEVGREFGWEPRLFLSQLVLFTIVALVLAKFAYKPLLAMLEQRKNQITEALENSERTRRELANAQSKAQEIIGQAGIQANKIIEEARVGAAKISEQEAQKAVSAAAQIIAKAKESNDAELARMKSELRNEVTRLVVETSAKVTGNILTVEQKQRLADDANRQLVNN
jgi:F-type H+-transporting ATPase subunit b